MRMQVKLTQEDLDALDEVRMPCCSYRCAAEDLSNLRTAMACATCPISRRDATTDADQQEFSCDRFTARPGVQVSKFTVGGRYHPMVARFSYDSYHKLRDEDSQHLPSNAVSTPNGAK